MFEIHSLEYTALNGTKKIIRSVSDDITSEVRQFMSNKPFLTDYIIYPRR
jgi:hypothetical protein